MAPSLPQGDAVALATYAEGINICVDLLGLKGKTSWSGKWGHDNARPPAAVKEKIQELVLAKGLVKSR